MLMASVQGLGAIISAAGRQKLIQTLTLPPLITAAAATNIAAGLESVAQDFVKTAPSDPMVKKAISDLLKDPALKREAIKAAKPYLIGIGAACSLGIILGATGILMARHRR